MDLVNLMQSMSMQDSIENTTQSNIIVFAATINGIHTDLVYGEFSQKLMVIATQYEKIGSLLKVVVDQVESDLNISEPVYSVSVVFGVEHLEQQAAARYLAEKLNIKKPLMCFLCLKSYDINFIKELTTVILNHPQRSRTQ